MKLLLIAAALLAPGSAWAATGDIGCIEAKLGPAAMQRIGDGVATAADNGTDPASTLDADRETLIAARDTCKKDNNWSADAARLAVSYTQARATVLGARKALPADGLDPDALTKLYAAIPDPDRASLIDKISPGMVGIIDLAARPAPPQSKDRARRHVLLLYAGMAGVEFYPADFAAT